MKLLLVAAALSLATAADFGRSLVRSRFLAGDEVSLEFDATDLSMSAPSEPVAAVEGPESATGSKSTKSAKATTNPKGEEHYAYYEAKSAKAAKVFKGESSTDAAGGCFGGVKGVTYEDDSDKCNCASVSCTKETCEDDMGGIWTEECPACDPDECDPLAPSEEDPSCTGPPEAIDRFGKKMYRRKLISREKPQDSEEGVFCHVIFELCEGESQLTHGMDSGFGDYYRLGATTEWADYTGTSEYSYGGMYKPTGARSYSPVTPLNESAVQLTIKEVQSKASDNDCTTGVDCLFGMSELACMAPIGTDFLLSKRPDHMGYEGTHQAYVPNFSREPGSGPYTVNVIGQGVALTELNIVVLSELLQPFSSDGNFSTIKEVNYLWANSYWSNAEWVWEDTNSTDLSRQMIRIMGSYGIRFNLMHSISREERPEAEWPRTDVKVIGEAFNLTNTTDQDPNVKWFVVGSSGYKRSIYPQILEWGFDIYGCNPSAVSKGYPYCGPNALYDQLAPGSDPNDRERSDIFEYYEGQPEPEEPSSEDYYFSKSKSFKSKSSKSTKSSKKSSLSSPSPSPTSSDVVVKASSAGPKFGGVFLADQGTNSLLLLRDLNGNGDAEDEGEYSVYFDGEGGVGLNPFTVHVGKSGFVYVGDGDADAVYRLEDINHNGNAMDEGEARVWFSAAGNAAGFTLPTPNGVWEADDGTVYVVNAGTGSQPQDAVYRTVDLNGDGNANGPGEAMIWIDLSVLVSELLGTYEGISSAFEIVFVGDTAYIMDSVGSQPDVILAARDVNGNGVIDSGELSIFLQAGNDLGVTDFFAALTKIDEKLVTITFTQNPANLWLLQDINGIDNPSQVNLAWNGLNLPPGKKANINFGIGAAQVGQPDIYTASNDSNGGVIRLLDLDGDGSYNSEGEAVVFRTKNSGGSTGRPRNVEVLPEFFQAQGYYGVSNVDDLNDVPYDVQGIVRLLRAGGGPDYAAVLQIYQEGVPFREGRYTLAGFASGKGDAPDGHLSFSKILPEAVEYFGTEDFLDQYIRSAIEGTGRFQFSDDKLRIDAITGGIGTLFSYWTQYKMNRSSLSAEDGNFSCIYGAPHLLDEAFAIYYGPRGRYSLFQNIGQILGFQGDDVNTVECELYFTEDPNKRIISGFINAIEHLAPNRPPLGSDDCTPPSTAEFPEMDNYRNLFMKEATTTSSLLSRSILSANSSEVPYLVERVYTSYAMVAPSIAIMSPDSDKVILSQLDHLRENPCYNIVPAAILVDTFDKIIEKLDNEDHGPISPPDMCPSKSSKASKSF